MLKEFFDKTKEIARSGLDKVDKTKEAIREHVLKIVDDTRGKIKTLKALHEEYKGKKDADFKGKISDEKKAQVLAGIKVEEPLVSKKSVEKGIHHHLYQEFKGEQGANKAANEEIRGTDAYEAAKENITKNAMLIVKQLDESKDPQKNDIKRELLRILRVQFNKFYSAHQVQFEKDRPVVEPRVMDKAQDILYRLSMRKGLKKEVYKLLWNDHAAFGWMDEADREIREESAKNRAEGRQTEPIMSKAERDVRAAAFKLKEDERRNKPNTQTSSSTPENPEDLAGYLGGAQGGEVVGMLGGEVPVVGDLGGEVAAPPVEMRTPAPIETEAPRKRDGTIDKTPRAKTTPKPAPRGSEPPASTRAPAPTTRARPIDGPVAGAQPEPDRTTVVRPIDGPIAEPELPALGPHEPTASEPKAEELPALGGKTQAEVEREMVRAALQAGLKSMNEGTDEMSAGGRAVESERPALEPAEEKAGSWAEIPLENSFVAEKAEKNFMDEEDTGEGFMREKTEELAGNLPGNTRENIEGVESRIADLEEAMDDLRKNYKNTSMDIDDREWLIFKAAGRINSLLNPENIKDLYIPGETVTRVRAMGQEFVSLAETMTDVDPSIQSELKKMAERLGFKASIKSFSTPDGRTISFGAKKSGEKPSRKEEIAAAVKKKLEKKPIQGKSEDEEFILIDDTEETAKEGKIEPIAKATPATEKMAEVIPFPAQKEAAEKTNSRFERVKGGDLMKEIILKVTSATDTGGNIPEKNPKKTYGDVYVEYRGKQYQIIPKRDQLILRPYPIVGDILPFEKQQGEVALGTFEGRERNGVLTSTVRSVLTNLKLLRKVEEKETENITPMTGPENQQKAA